MKVEIDSAVLTFHTLIRHVRFSAGTRTSRRNRLNVR